MNNEIKVIKFFDIDFDALTREEVSVSWENGYGYIIDIHDRSKPAGQTIQAKAYFPQTLNKAMQHEVRMAALGD